MKKWKTPKGSYIEDILGQTFNRLTVIDYPTQKDNDNRWLWKCQCLCDNKSILYVSMHKLKIENTQSCGCLRKDNCIKHNKDMALDLTGHTQDSITILYKIEESKTMPGGNLWRCRCSCGEEFNVRVGELRRGEYGEQIRKSTSCCPKCSTRSLGEKKIGKLLNNLNITYEKEKTFPNCKDKGSLRFDFYLPKYNCCIEYDGEHHYGDRNGGYITEEFVKNIQKHDKIKNNYCSNHNIKLIRIPYYDYNKLTEEYSLEVINE